MPGATLIGFAFGAVGMAGTSYMRSWLDFEFVQLSILPLFLFSATFYPLSTYLRALQILVYQARGKGVSRSHRIRHMHAKPGMLTRIPAPH